MSFSLKADQKVSFSITATDEMGNPATFTGTPVFAVDDAAILALTDNGDGTGSVAANGPLGTSVLSVTDTETSGEEFMGSVAVDVVAGDVTAVEIAFGEPEEVTPDE